MNIDYKIDNFYHAFRSSVRKTDSAADLDLWYSEMMEFVAVVCIALHAEAIWIINDILILNDIILFESLLPYFVYNLLSWVYKYLTTNVLGQKKI